MTEEQAIRDRLFSCIDDCQETLKEIAAKTGINYSYLSGLRSKPNPEVKASLIAAFCKKYGYSPAFIILGKQPKKPEKEKPSGQLDRIEDTLDDIITTLLEALTTSKHQGKMTDLTKLMAEARKRKN